MEFRVGDLVQLKSGGPEMTVCQYPFEDIDGNKYPNRIQCRWFDNEGKIKHLVFDISEIERL